MESGFASFVRKLRRTKPLGSNVLDTSLKRCLSTFDITLLGVGHMMGSGIYVLTATVAKSVAGPAIVVAFLISGVASLLAAFSYAEFGVRFPKAGSAYSYTYLAVGEFWAFVVGWNVVLENVIGLAAVARACSAYIDSLLGNIMKSWSEEHVGRINVPFFSEEPDLFAFVIILAFLIIMSVGVRASTHINNIFSMVNIGVALLVIAVGSYFANFDNWTNPDTGGFMPFGWHGVLAASASCFYAYVGFDSIASSGEEARDPQKSLPIATFVSMSIVTVVYVAISAVLTLMVNYKDITSESGLPDALAANGATWAKVVVIMGAVCGMATVLMGNMFALTRIVYAMAEDGLLFSWFSWVNARTQLPLAAMYAFTSLSAVLAVLLDINTLVEMMSIGTLLAYLVVSASLIIVRYMPLARLMGEESQELPDLARPTLSDESVDDDTGGRLRNSFSFLYTLYPFDQPPGIVVSYSITVLTVTVFILGFLTPLMVAPLADGSVWAVLALLLLLGVALASFGIILLFQQSSATVRYKMPLVPLLPTLSIIINATLMTTLQPLTWARLVIWIAVGE
ncbi:cationic amino acid transporter, putative [Ixodes scapularis]|uniref:Cationic amino acid transporter, putative n=1 Tax=Ixodes scapularis TaxID=6945 RepID=B7P272_IXOSC|nr:cationic amino acid transporter, putative [Ixodes scapularis]|eukprot:XP_002401622.1 cationic amino acid transporter, putative [Ixodes scapularis]